MDDDGYTLDTEFYRQMVEEAENASLEYANQKISVGDFISIYSSGENIDSEDDIYFGKITDYDTDTGIITYVKSSAEEIEASMDLYIQPVLEGDDLLDEEAKNKIEEEVYRQVLSSGFAEEAGFILAELLTLWEMVEEMNVEGLPNANQWEEMGNTLGKTNISKDLMDMLDLSSETELDAERYADSLEGLLTKYSEMLEKETDWVKLVQEEMCQAEVNLNGFVIYFKADFVVRADMNIAMGASIQYQVGKRYTFWVKVGLFKPSAGSSTMDLVDEQFAFQFYVMGKLGIKMGVEATAGFAIGAADVARVGVHLELGPYVKLYGFFIYEYERSREANTSVWISDERMAGALYLDFGLYLIVGVDAAALDDLFEVSYDFVDTEFPLLEAGEKKYPYAFRYEPMEDELVIIRDEDADSSNGITMILPEEYRAVKYCNLQTGKLGDTVYDWSKYNATFSNPNFKIDENGRISVDVPENTRYIDCDLTLTYKYGKLAFSQYDMQVTIPLVWTNLSTEEISQYYTASVRVGNATDGYETVWSKRVVKNQEFTLPTEDEVKALIGYDDVKYSSFTCFDGAGQKTSLIDNKTFDCDVDYKSYSITVNDVQNADGSTEAKTFTAHYGETFDFSILKETGTNSPNVNPDKAKFTKYSNVTTTATVTVGTDKDGKPITEVIDLNQPITGKVAEAIAIGNVTATANYVDDSVLVTYTFAGIDVANYVERIRKGTASTYDFNAVVANEGMMVRDISPEQGAVYSAVTYVVECEEIVGEKYTLSFEENGGSTVNDIERVGGSLIGTLPTPERKGYTFLGWFTDDGMTSQFTERLMPKNNITLYAKWEANTYTVTFHVNGGDSFAEASNGTKTVTYDSTYGNLPTATKSGYGFIGWFTAQEGGTEVTAENRVTITSDQTLYAHWRLLKNISSNVFDFGEAESYYYDTGITYDIVYTFRAETGETYTEDSFTMKYKAQNADEYVDIPFNPGVYDVLVSRAEDDHYTKFEYLYTGVLVVKEYVANGSYFSVRAGVKGGIGGIYTIKNTITWSDGSSDEFSLDIDKGTWRYGYSERYAVNPSSIRQKGSYNVQNMHLSSVIYDIMGNQRVIEDDYVKKASTKVDKTWSLGSYPNVDYSMKTFEVSDNGKIRVRIDTYGFDGVLSKQGYNLTYATTSSGTNNLQYVEIDGDYFIIDGSKFTAEQTVSVYVRNNGGRYCQVASFKVTHRADS